MRFGALSALVVLGASLAASASPIRVVVTEVSSVRYGHAAHDGNANVAHLSSSPLEFISSTVITHPTEHKEHNGGGHHFCQTMRAKAVDASNAFRQWFGFEPVHIDVVPQTASASRPYHVPHISSVDIQNGRKAAVQPLPVLPFVGTPVRPAFNAVDAAEGERGWTDRQGARPMWIHRHHRLRGSFLRRVHHALMTLGPWEGRAVAFVLGCGIGVLLRMIWVMALVTARAFRGSRAEETEYDVVFDEAELLVPPPQYTIIQGSEAVPVSVDEKSDKEPVA